MAYMIKRGVEYPDRARADYDDGREPRAQHSGVFARRTRTRGYPLRDNDIELLASRSERDWRTLAPKAESYVASAGRGQIGGIFALFFAAVVLVCLATGLVSPVHDTASSWLFTSCSLWLCTCPAWLVRPNRYEVKRLLFSGAIAFVFVGGAVLISLAIAALAMNGSP
jgi:hypothetical protein